VPDRDHFNLLRWFECLAQRKHKLVHVENIYGDEIPMLGCRSIWRCSHCGKHFYKSRLAAVSGPMPPKPEACIHDPYKPEGCYRVRCQLAKQCAAATHDAGVNASARQPFSNQAPQKGQNT
jgi:hypothetical protein